MEFKILGPFEVSNDRGAVALGGVKSRTLLAVLLLNANEPVSAERLAQALWGEDAPAGAIKTVQVHVSRLRKALGDGNVVETTPAGYCLRVRPGELDAEHFEQLVEDGRQALADGHAEQAAAVLREALTLWRGTPLAELEFEPFAQAEIARLDEQRLAAVEARVEADLAAGHEAELIGELQHLVAAHPTRERLAGQLMLALYRCGRQAEALEAYSDARRVLVAEIGVEPGPELRRLQDAILRQDASLEPELLVADLPRELDAAAAPPLEGRREELGWLRERWEQARTGSGVLVTVHGEHGIGKSRLAAELAGETHAAGAAVVYAAGTGPADGVLGALVRAREATRPTLVVIDDADRAGDDARAGLVATPRAVGDVPVLVLVLSGEDDPGALARLPPDGSLLLQPLGVDAVHAIAVRYAPGHGGEEVPAEWLLDASGGVPLRVHELASQWARREAARRVGAVAEQTAAGRAELRTMEDELAVGVVDLQAAGEHLALISDDDAPVVCPFKGLASFDVADAPYFFGREQLVAELVARLVGAPLLGVVGPSGSGKSSVVRAGLLPALAGGVLPDSGHWTQVLVRPGEHPLRELSDAVAGLGDRRMVIAVDQFEETFTTCRDEEERAAFIAALVRAADDPHEQCVVVIAIRADYYGRCAAYPELSSLLAANHVLVRPMQSDELRRAIELPAHRAGLRVEPELTDALVADTEEEPGALPLLSTALLELWQRRHGRRLRHADYERMGGVRAAVARLAEGAFERLDDAQRTVARGVFMRLAGEGAEGAVERRRVPLTEVETGDEDAAGIVALLTDQRLLTISAGSVEVAHEALLREWPRLRGWIEEDREGMRIHRRVTAAAEEWGRLHEDEDALYAGTHLTEALEWRASRHPALNPLEREFLDASDARRRRVRATRRRRIEFAFAALLVSLAAITVVAGVALHQQREATSQRDIAVSRELAASATSVLDTDPALGLSLARRAEERRDTQQAEAALRQATYEAREVAAWPAHDGWLFAATPSDDGRYVVTAGQDGVVRIWRLASGRVLATIHSHRGYALGASLDPDGGNLATVGDDGVVAISDKDGRHRRVLLRLRRPHYATSVDFSPDGRRVTVGATDGNVRIIPVDGRGRVTVLRGHHGIVLGARFNADGTSVVSASADRSARIWDLARGTSTSLRHPDVVVSASFSPDGRHVATADQDGIVRIWSVSGGGRPTDFRASQGALLSVRYAHDGRRLVTAGEDGVVRVWDVLGGPALDELKGHRGKVTQADFVPGRNAVVSAGVDGTLRVWRPAATAMMHGPVRGVHFSPDGRHVVTGGDDGVVRVWDLANGSATELAVPGSPTHARVSPDGARIATASEDGSVRIWSQDGRSVGVSSDRTPKYAAALDRAGRRIAVAGKDPRVVVQRLGGGGRVVLRGHTDAVYDLDFSPDGRHLVTASQDRSARVWDVRTGKLERILRGHRDAVLSAAYSNDGRRVVTTSSDGTVRIWRVDDGSSVVLRGHEGTVESAQFNPAGDRVVSAGQDGTIRVWDSTGGATLVVLYTHQAGASGAEFSPDGRRVVSAGDDGIVRVSPCNACGSTAALLRLARTLDHHQLSAIERQRYLPNGR